MINTCYISVCIERKGERIAFIVQGRTWSEAERHAEMFTPRIGYCGNSSLQEAVIRCGLMERNEANGWGVIPNAPIRDRG